jgi:hypothetical protein
MRTISDTYEHYYDPSEHLAAVKIILEFKGRVVMWDREFSSPSGVSYKGEFQLGNVGTKAIYTSSR